MMTKKDKYYEIKEWLENYDENIDNHTFNSAIFENAGIIEDYVYELKKSGNYDWDDLIQY